MATIISLSIKEDQEIFFNAQNQNSQGAAGAGLADVVW
jgi:hypothetical protein